MANEEVTKTASKDSVEQNDGPAIDEYSRKKKRAHRHRSRAEPRANMQGSSPWHEFSVRYPVATIPRPPGQRHNFPKAKKRNPPGLGSIQRSNPEKSHRRKHGKNRNNSPILHSARVSPTPFSELIPSSENDVRPKGQTSPQGKFNRDVFIPVQDDSVVGRPKFPASHLWKVLHALNFALTITLFVVALSKAEINEIGYKKNKDDLNEMLSVLRLEDERVVDNVSTLPQLLHQNFSSIEWRDIIEAIRGERNRQIDDVVKQENDNLDTLHSDFEWSKKSLELLESESADLEDDLHIQQNKLSKHIRQYNKDIGRLDRTISQLTTSHEINNRKTASTDETTDSIKSQLVSLEEKNTGINDRIQLLESNVATIEDRMSFQSQSATDSLIARVDDLTHQLDNMKSSRVTQDQLQSLNEEVSRISSDLYTKIESGEEAIDRLRRDVSDTNERVLTVEKSKQELQKAQNDLTINEAVIKNNIEHVQSKIVDIHDELQSVKNSKFKILGIENSVTGIKNDIADFTNEASVTSSLVDNDLKLLHEKVADLDRNLTNLSKQIDIRDDSSTKRNGGNPSSFITEQSHLHSDASNLSDATSSTLNEVKNALEASIEELKQELRAVHLDNNPVTPEFVSNLIESSNQKALDALDNLKKTASEDVEKIESSVREELLEIDRKLHNFNQDFVTKQYVDTVAENVNQELTNALDEIRSPVTQPIESVSDRGTMTSTPDTTIEARSQDFASELRDVESRLDEKMNDIINEMRAGETQLTEEYVNRMLQDSQKNLRDNIADVTVKFNDEFTTMKQQYDNLLKANENSASLQEVEILTNEFKESVVNVQTKYDGIMAKLQEESNSGISKEEVENLIKSAATEINESMRLTEEELNLSMENLMQTLEDTDKKLPLVDELSTIINELRNEFEVMQQRDNQIRQEFAEFENRLDDENTRNSVTLELVQSEIEKANKTPMDAVKNLEMSVNKQADDQVQMRDDIAELPSKAYLNDYIKSHDDKIQDAVAQMENHQQNSDASTKARLRSVEEELENSISKEFVENYVDTLLQDTMNDLSNVNSLQNKVDDLKQVQDTLGKAISDIPKMELIEEQILQRHQLTMDVLSQADIQKQELRDKMNALEKQMQVLPTAENVENLSQSLRNEIANEIQKSEINQDEQLRDGLEGVTQMLEKLQHRDSPTRQDIDNLSQKIQTELTNLKHSEADAVSKVKGLESELVEIENTIGSLFNNQESYPDHADLKQMSQQINDDVAQQIQNKVNDFQQPLNDVTNKLSQLQESMKELKNSRADFATKDNLHEMTQRTSDEIQSVVKTFESTILPQIETINQRQGGVEKSLPEIQKSIDSAERKIADLPTTQFVVDKVKQIEELTGASLVSVENKIRKEIDSLTDQHQGDKTQEREEIEKLKNEINKINSANTKLATEVETATENLALLASDAKASSRAVEELTKQNKVSNDMIARTENSVVNLQNNINDLREAIPDQTDILDTVDKTIQSALKDVDTGVDKAEEAIGKIDLLRAQVDESRSRINQMKVETKKDLQVLSDRLDDSQRNDAKEEDRLNRLEAHVDKQMQNLRESAESNKQNPELENMQTRLSQIENRIRDLPEQSDSSEYKRVLDGVRKDLNNVQKLQEAIQRQSEVMQNDVTRVSTDIQGMNEKLKEDEKVTQNLNNVVNNIDTKLQEIKADIMESEEKVQESISEMQERQKDNDLGVSTIEEVQASQFRILQAIERATFGLKKRMDRTEAYLEDRK